MRFGETLQRFRRRAVFAGFAAIFCSSLLSELFQVGLRPLRKPSLR
jgi:hypothetical protein